MIITDWLISKHYLFRKSHEHLIFLQTGGLTSVAVLRENWLKSHGEARSAIGGRWRYDWGLSHALSAQTLYAFPWLLSVTVLHASVSHIRQINTGNKKKNLWGLQGFLGPCMFWHSLTFMFFPPHFLEIYCFSLVKVIYKALSKQLGADQSAVHKNNIKAIYNKIQKWI